MAPGLQMGKLFRLAEILRHETDEYNPITTSALCQKLSEYGFSCERRALYREIRMLEQQGVEVMKARIGHEYGYYIADRSFSLPELRIIIDALQAANFIPEQKTAELSAKIAALGGIYEAELLSQDTVRFNSRKHSNETVYYTVGFLQEAIHKRQKVSFLYFDLNENRERVYRRDKTQYVAEPLSLVYHEDRYYLVCYHSEYDNRRVTYRIDRMEGAKILPESISPEAVDALEHADMAEYTEQVFRMFGGRTKNVTLRFDDSLIGAVFDKFGEGAKIVRVDDSTCELTTDLQISPTFFGWVFQFGGKMRIVKSEDIYNEYMMMHKQTSGE